MKTLPATPLAAPPTPGSQEQIASQRLETARGEGRVFISDDSLAALLRLAAHPTQAPDALLLLHELQVQQIEIDVQLDELRRVDASTGR